MFLVHLSTRHIDIKFLDIIPPLIENPIVEPAEPVAGESIEVRVNVLDPGLGVEAVYLYYRVASGSWNAVEMTYIGNNLWRALILAQDAPCTIEYYIEAVDKAGNNASTTIYTIEVSAITTTTTPISTPTTSPTTSPTTTPVETTPTSTPIETSIPTTSLTEITTPAFELPITLIVIAIILLIVIVVVIVYSKKKR